MKRLSTVLLAITLALAGFSSAPAHAVGLGSPEITAPTEGSSHLQGSTAFTDALPQSYQLVVTEAQAATAAYDAAYNPVMDGDSAAFSVALSPGSYTFTVRDSLQAAADSVTFTVTKPVVKPVKKPSKPRSFHSARGNHKVRLGWKAPTSNGGAKITKYQVKRHGAVRTVGASTRHKTFTGLKNGHRYNFYVRAKNKAGWGKWAHTTGTPKAPKPKPKPKPKPSSGHPVKEYQNCDAMHRDYPHGVGKPGAQDQGGSVTNFYRSTAVYNLNTKSDRDKDGIACEKA